MKFDYNASLEFLRELMRIDCTEGKATEGNPFGENLTRALHLVLDKMRELGFITENLDNYCGTATYGEGELFDVLGHLDTVPVGDGWDFDPFGAVISGGKLYGRGALDDKGPMIAAVAAAARLIDEGLKPKKQLRFIFGLNEETGWKCMKHFEKTHRFAPLGFSPDGDFPVINAEKGMFCYNIDLKKPANLLKLHSGDRANIVPAAATATVLSDGAEKDFTATGKAAHASHPELGESALIKLLLSMDEVPELKRIGEIFREYDGSTAGLNMRDEESGALTLNLGTARIIGDVVRFELDVRCPVTISKDTVTACLQKIDGFRASLFYYHEPLYIKPDHPFVSTLLSAYEKVTGKKAEPIAIGGGTFARLLPLGCAFGPALPGVECPIHQANECVSLDHYQLMCDIYYEALKTLCFE